MKAVSVPVHQYIYSVLYSRIDDGAGALFAELWVLQIILDLALIVIDFDSDGCSYQFGIPVLDDVLHGLSIIKTWPEYIPSETHSLEFHSIARLVHQCGPLDTQMLHFRSLL